MLISDLELIGEEKIYIAEFGKEMSILSAKKLLAQVNIFNMKCDKIVNDISEELKNIDNIEKIKSYDYKCKFPEIPEMIVIKEA